MGMEFNNPERPESRNLLMIYSLLSGKEVSELENDLSQMGWGTFKKIFTEELIESLKPIQERYQILINDPYELNKILIQGKEKAEAIANKTLSRINLLDTPEIITKKLKRAKSDSYMGMEFNNPDRPCLLYTSPSPRDRQKSRMPSSA